MVLVKQVHAYLPEGDVAIKPNVKQNLMIGFGILALVTQTALILFSLVRHHHVQFFYIPTWLVLGMNLFNSSKWGKARIARRSIPLHVVPQPDALQEAQPPRFGLS